MATAAQIAANRANAQKSTGPRTVAGKQRSRMAALEHGLTAATLVLPHEDALGSVGDPFRSALPIRIYRYSVLIGAEQRESAGLRVGFRRLE